VESLFRGEILKQSSQIVGICEQTSLVWRHKILSICATLTDEEHVVSDSLRSYYKFMKEIGVKWIKIPSGKKEKEGYTLLTII